MDENGPQTAPRKRASWPVVALSVIAVAYPLAVYFGLQFMQPRLIGLLLAALFGMRLLFSFKSPSSRPTVTVKPLLPIMLLAMICSLGAFVLNNHALLTLTPAFINYTSMITFALTLRRGPSMIERFARLTEPKLDAAGVRYTRAVTKAWCVFFFVNGSMALYTAFFTSMETWTLYNGLLAYLLMGVFFAAEYLIRRRVRGQVSP